MAEPCLSAIWLCYIGLAATSRLSCSVLCLSAFLSVLENAGVSHQRGKANLAHSSGFHPTVGWPVALGLC